MNKNNFIDLMKHGEQMFNQAEQVLDNYWNLIEHADWPFTSLHSTTNKARAFPVYDLIEQKDGGVRLEMAVAGYTKDQIKVEKERNSLIVTGRAKSF